MQRALDILQSTFGYPEFRPLQAEIISTLLEGRDALALMPTGGGKSLCYQIPALLREGTGVVVSPLIALMRDQVTALKVNGIRAAYLNSTLHAGEVRQVEEELQAGELDLLYVAPERLVTEPMLALLEASKVALFAIDEAHCVSQWGHDFRKEYKQLSVLHERFPDVPRIAVTATADQRTREEIVSELQLQDAERFIASFDRPNIRYLVQAGAENRAGLWRFLETEHPEDAGIVYCLSRKSVEETAQWLSDKGRVAIPYHAGLAADVRTLHQERFLREEGVIVVATIAFGMGIDKPDVRFVAHLNLPKSIEAYYQETGRAGRDGEPASAWMAYGLQDVIQFRQWLQASDAGDLHKRVQQQKLDALLGFCELVTCRRQALLAYFGEKYPEPCGNCDNCLNPPKTVDGSVEAQKALSCVYRTGQRFGVNYLIDVLTGKEDDRILANRHDQISTFGIGQEITGVRWRGIFRHLLAQGFLEADMARMGGLRLTEKSRPLLRGEIGFLLREQADPLKAKARKKQKKAAANVAPEDQALWEALRALRLRLAGAQNVPPYVVFHDSTLRSMAAEKPETLEQMAEISGVGEAKLERYGAEFLGVIAEFA